MSKEVVHTDAAPGPFQGAPYSQAITANGFVFVAGQLGLEPGASAPVAGGIAAQTEQALRNLGAILEAAGSSLDQVVKTTVFLQNLDDFAGMNEVYGRRFGEKPPLPARRSRSRSSPPARSSRSRRSRSTRASEAAPPPRRRRNGGRAWTEPSALRARRTPARRRTRGGRVTGAVRGAQAEREGAARVGFAVR